MSNAARPKVALYWCASCGGCEETVVDLNEALLDIVQLVDIVFWPVALDFKREDLEVHADGDIAVSFINGAVRTDEQAEMARLLRAKSKLLVAMGSCAHLGGVPGLANLTSRAHVMQTAYRQSPTVDNLDGPIPQSTSKLATGETVHLPFFWEQACTLDQVVEVDYVIPGCPPPPDLFLNAIRVILSGELPSRGSVLAPDKVLCDTCDRRNTKVPGRKLKKLYRPHEIVANPDDCFLDQGIVCCGPATRSGCGEKCLNGNMPCTGCFGPGPGIVDQGGRMLTALATMFDATTEERALELAAEVLDPAGTFGRYSVPGSVLFARLPKESR